MQWLEIKNFDHNEKQQCLPGLFSTLTSRSQYFSISGNASS
jgi:hypothetical protein